ncbi:MULTISPECIES: transglycosylase SLT domain-containing protein [unclassified Dehalobacter]|uniref:transglycosylase SLT domain-containing protein n=1 Tax=unclassified Dehalobacter TaxID=2635733 RepID=UPI00104F7784|nr:MULTISPECIES: transglycosylase SLT domain-containing protein [unclassified Dehalobacter]TCX51958.1 hypothetical protein C1I36_06470 [Dehalobacter sp. 14DCB1]TCX53018.1 hypothetical protein C1I38_08150 [Dehalobacter sp. 12DCB1]
MKKPFLPMLLMLLMLLLAGCTEAKLTQDQEAQKEVIEAQVQAMAEPEKVYPIYDIPMPAELQKYTYDLCEEYRLSYELVLGVIYTESRFIETANSGSSQGLMQISRGTGGWVSEEVRIRDFDPFDPRQNIAVGVWYLNYLRDYWSNHGYSDEDTFSLMLISYNRGITGCKEYVKKIWARK